MDKESFKFWSRRIIAWYLVAIVGGVAGYTAVMIADYELIKMVIPMAALIVGFYFGARTNDTNGG